MSATLSDPILKLTSKYLQTPKHINVCPDNMTVERIEQKYITVDTEKKLDLLVRVLQREKPKQCIVFVERKRTADHVHKQMKVHLPKTAVTHGDMPQNRRERIMTAFRKGEIALLIATDVMSRGIDVRGISHIINFDLPHDIESYVHRIGRTGRMGKDGMAISFVTPDQGQMLTSIERTINSEIQSDSIEGFVAFTPRKIEEPVKKSGRPVYGRSSKRYSRRL